MDEYEGFWVAIFGYGDRIYTGERGNGWGDGDYNDCTNGNGWGDGDGWGDGVGELNGNGYTSSPSDHIEG